MSRSGGRHAAIQREVEKTTASLFRHVRQEGPLAVVQAPPGSGKTHLLLQAVREAYRRRQRVAVATQTRSQADDICRRLATEFNLPAIRFVGGKGSYHPPLHPGITILSDKKYLAYRSLHRRGDHGEVGTGSTAASIRRGVRRRSVAVAWADCMLLGQVAPRFVLIGDPGQIPPVVSIDASRWETAPPAPHRPAPELIRNDPGLDALNLDLAATRRLPHDTAGLGRNQNFPNLSEKRITKAVRGALRDHYGGARVELSCSATFENGDWVGTCEIDGHAQSYRVRE